MHSRICHQIDAILSFVIILKKIDKLNKNRSRQQCETIKIYV
jgi:GTP-binding protein EngB required for normal cell division